jgi:hypothetical protein
MAQLRRRRRGLHGQTADSAHLFAGPGIGDEHASGVFGTEAEAEGMSGLASGRHGSRRYLRDASYEELPAASARPWQSQRWLMEQDACMTVLPLSASLVLVVSSVFRHWLIPRGSERPGPVMSPRVARTRRSGRPSC